MIFQARTKTLKKINDNIFELTLVHDNDLFYFNAGQYVWIETKYGRRAFSISSSSSSPMEIKILFKSGVGSAYMNHLSLLKAGDTVNIIGPRGVLRIPDPETETIYIAGGVGITPFLSIIRSLRDSKESRDITLLTVNSTQADEIYIEELIDISKEKKDFKIISIVGKLTETQLSKVLSKRTNTECFVIGSQGFVDAASTLLNNLKFPASKIHFEENFPSSYKLTINLNDNSFFKLLADQSATHIIVTDVNGKIVYANKTAEFITGYTFEEMIGNTPRLWGGLMNKETYEKMWQIIKVDKKVFKSELKNIRKNGEVYDVQATISPILENGKLVGFRGVEDDITEEIKTRNELKKIRDLMIDRVLEKDKKL